MRKIYFKYHTGYCGMDSAEVVEFDDDVTDETLDLHAWEGALDNAETYGIYPSEDFYLEDENDEGLGDEYSSSIEGYWEEYDAEKHDGTY